LANKVPVFIKKDVKSLAGFTASRARPGEEVNIVCRALMTSNDPMFHRYLNGICSNYLSGLKFNPSNIAHMLILSHADSTAHIYINDFKFGIEVLYKRAEALDAGAEIYWSDIADVNRVTLSDINVATDDNIVCVLKVGWKFVLYFDFMRSPNEDRELDVTQVELALAQGFRTLQFEKVYSLLQDQPRFKKVVSDGWFPFLELLGSEFDQLMEIYSLEEPTDSLGRFLEAFDQGRMSRITDSWWYNAILNEKRKLLEAGINAFLENSESGSINCIKNLSTEIEGILRRVYELDRTEYASTTRQLLDHIKDRAHSSARDPLSLLLPDVFIDYLKDVVFAKTPGETESSVLSRHTVSHGVASAKSYERSRALQCILVVDQLRYYL
jgi:hypothetical protein